MKGASRLICARRAARALTWSPALCMSIVSQYHKRVRECPAVTSSARTAIHRALSTAKTISHICMLELIESEMQEAERENKECFLSVLPTDRDN